MKKPSTPRLLRTLLGTLALVLTGTLAQAQNAPGKGETVRVQDYPGGGNSLVRVAIAKKYCEKYGIKCEVKQLANGPLGVQAFMAGELEIAYAGPEVVLPAIARGADAKMIAGGYAPQPFIVITAPDTTLSSGGAGYPAIMQDFKGKKIGVPARGSHAETVFTDMLVEAGLSAKDVTYVAVGGPNTAVPPLVNKQIDAVIIFTPVDGICEIKKACKVVVDLRKGEGPRSVKASLGTGVPLWMHEAYIKANPHVLAAFRMAMKDADAFVKNPANFDELMSISDSFFKMPGEGGDQIMRVTMKNSVPGFDVTVRPAALQSVIDYMTQNKQLPTVLKAADIIQP